MPSSPAGGASGSASSATAETRASWSACSVRRPRRVATLPSPAVTETTTPSAVSETVAASIPPPSIDGGSEAGASPGARGGPGTSPGASTRPGRSGGGAGGRSGPGVRRSGATRERNPWASSSLCTESATALRSASRASRIRIPSGPSSTSSTSDRTTPSIEDRALRRSSFTPSSVVAAAIGGN